MEMQKSPAILLMLAITASLLFLNFQNTPTGQTHLTTNTNLPYIQKETPGWFQMKPEARLSVDDLLQKHHADLGLTEWDELQLIRTDVDQLGYAHHRYQQFHRGIPIETAIFLVHEKDGFVQTFNGKLVPNLDVDASPAFSKEAAIEEALQVLPAEKYIWEDGGAEKMLQQIRRNDDATFYPNPELVWTKKSGIFNQISYRLAYKMDIQATQPLFRQRLFLDAVDASVLQNIELMHTVNAIGTAETAYSGTRTITTDSIAPNQFRLRETGRGNGIETYNMMGSEDYGEAVDFVDDDNYWNNVNPEKDEVATDAHWAAEMTFDYLDSLHNYTGVDGNGMAFITYVHYDVNLVNAFWNGQWASIGDGNNTWGPLTAIDVIAHEFGHGVTDATANLIYMDESGALNESFSDIIGAAVEFWASPELGDWLIGEDFGTNGNIFRDMSNPNAEGDPDTYLGTNYYIGPDDDGGVHTNSGVQNFWFYLLTEGGTGTNDHGDMYEVSALGIDTAAQIALRNLRFYLTPSSIHLDAREGALQAAEDLYGVCSEPVTQTRNAWFAVGLGNGFSDNDLRMVDISEPNGVTCGLTTEEFPSFSFRYNGCVMVDSATQIPVSMQVDNGAIVTDTITLQQTLAPSDTLNHTFGMPINGLETAGNHTIRIWLNYEADSYARNDTLAVEIFNVIEQNSDFSGEELQNPASACFMAEEIVNVEIGFFGCDSIAAGTELSVSYSLNQGDTITEMTTLINTIFSQETFNYTFDTPLDFTDDKGQNNLESWVNFSTDFLNENDVVPVKIVTNPQLTIEDKLLTFENGDVSLDSIYTQSTDFSSVSTIADEGNNQTTGLEMTGGDSFTAFFAGLTELPDENNVWEVNEIFKAETCICVDATNMTEMVWLSFDLRQFISPVYQIQFGIELPYASPFRVLVNQEQVSETYLPTFPTSPFERHSLDLSDWAGTSFEVCFETRNFLAPEFDPIGSGDRAILDNIEISAEIVSTSEIITKFSGLTVSPNPTNGAFDLSWESELSGSVDIEIFDTFGKRVKVLTVQNNIGQNNVSTDLINVANGAYFIRLSDGKVAVVKRIVKF